ncbi:hypothetical protein [Ferrovibrio xuzhouensis]|uniref:Uncharacterized protein n=1 Tax=Ferrovibrio xuzhouensis TaxID=1576914 RepID=A0ABV7VM45_9PROT
MRSAGLPVRYLINDHPSSVARLRSLGYDVDIVDLIAGDGWEGRWLDEHPDTRVWINDRLHTDADHARRVKAAGRRLATFDDRGDGAALADLHVAALSFEDGDRLQGQVVLQGVDYLLLDAGLAALRRERGRADRILLTMGGADTWGITPRVMQALLDRRREATVVLGPAFAHHDAVDAVLMQAPAGLFTIHRNGVPSLTEEMARHDLAITAGGMTPFEANAVGLPCIVIASEGFEVPVGRALERLGGCIFAGYHAEADMTVLDRDLPLSSMSRAAMKAVDLKGCSRVMAALVAVSKEQA